MDKVFVLLLLFISYPLIILLACRMAYSTCVAISSRLGTWRGDLLYAFLPALACQRWEGRRGFDGLE